MKKDENNEMDLLLRSLARREGTRSFPRVRVTGGSAHSAHLDADELSSYAERTLPAATRARYTIHLADCAQCRKIVAELAPAVSVSVRDHPEQQGVTTFWQKFRHLFSLPVLRYAVPALGLFAIVAVGIVVFRQQSRSDLVARNTPVAEQVTVPQNQPTEVPPQEKAATYADSNAAAPTGSQVYDSAPNLSGERQAKSNEQGQATGAGRGVSAPAPAVVAKDAEADKTAAAVPQPTFAPEPSAPPPPKPQDHAADARTAPVTQTEAARKVTAPQTEAAARAQSERPAKEPGFQTQSRDRSGERTAEEERARAKAEKREAQAPGSVASNAAPNRGYAELRRAEALRTDSAKKKADDETAETRAVAGRRFRRQGNLWVDTAYHSGLSLTVIGRGSEQYRALVADEPSIRSIAEQLQGEVILIWKGRGYRIR